MVVLNSPISESSVYKNWTMAVASNGLSIRLLQVYNCVLFLVFFLDLIYYLLLFLIAAKLELRQIKFKDPNLSDLNLMEAIASMCPQLTHLNVTFDLSPMSANCTHPYEIRDILATDPLPNVIVN